MLVSRKHLRGARRKFHYRWKDGKPNCLTCNKELQNYKASYCREHYPRPIMTEDRITLFRENQRKIWIGRKFTKEHKKNLSIAHIGMKPKTAGWNKGLPAWNRGLKGFRAGSLNNMWKGGITPINNSIRMSIEYKTWRKHVFNRDDYTCQSCGIRGRKLQADHELPFSLYPDLRFEILNGRTLCVNCHHKTPTWGEGVKKMLKAGLFLSTAKN